MLWGGNSAVVNESGAISSTLYYEPFGQTTGTAPAAFPFAFTGRLPIASDFYYYRSRFYDANTGRFISEDPIGFRGGPNLYAYVRNNPTNWLDPLGLCDQSRPTTSAQPSTHDYSENCAVLNICNSPWAPPQTLTGNPDTLSPATCNETVYCGFNPGFDQPQMPAPQFPRVPGWTFQQWWGTNRDPWANETNKGEVGSAP